VNCTRISEALTASTQKGAGLRLGFQSRSVKVGKHSGGVQKPPGKNSSNPSGFATPPKQPFADNYMVL
jgi:hypothetical protein